MGRFTRPRNAVPAECDFRFELNVPKSLGSFFVSGKTNLWPLGQTWPWPPSGVQEALSTFFAGQNLTSPIGCLPSQFAAYLTGDA